MRFSISGSDLLKVSRRLAGVLRLYFRKARMKLRQARRFALFANQLSDAEARLLVEDTRGQRCYIPCTPSQEWSPGKGPGRPYFRELRAKLPKREDPAHSPVSNAPIGGADVINFARLLPQMKRTPRQVKPPRKKRAESKKCRTNKISRAFTAIVQRGEFNRFSRGWKGDITEPARSILKSAYLAPKTPASDWTLDIQQPNLLVKIRQLLLAWTKPRHRAQVVLFGVVEHIEDFSISVEAVDGSGSVKIQSARRIAPPGRAGTSGPYLFLGLVGANPTAAGGIEVLDASARPVLSAYVPFPLDSNYERYVFRALWRWYLVSQPHVDIEKPLRPEPIGRTQVLLDAHIRYAGRLLRFENLGSVEEKYLERKCKALRALPPSELVHFFLAYLLDGRSSDEWSQALFNMLRQIEAKLGMPVPFAEGNRRAVHDMLVNSYCWFPRPDFPLPLIDVGTCCAVAQVS